MKYNWDEIMLKSDYVIATNLRNVLEDNNIEELKKGIDSLIHSAKADAELNVFFALKNLMNCILKGILNPKLRTGNWLVELSDLRDEIEYLKEDNTFITDQYLQSIWNEAFREGKDLAEIRTGKKYKLEPLNWKDVLLKKYVNYKKEPAKRNIVKNLQRIPKNNLKNDLTLKTAKV